MNRSSFEQCALASGLVTEHQIDEALSTLRPPEGAFGAKASPPSEQELAHRLTEIGAINVWQAKQLLEGRTKFTLGPYRIVDSLGQGGMGQVFKAEHSLTKRTVAIKVLPRDRCTPEAIANFAREFQALAKLDHRAAGSRRGRGLRRQRVLHGDGVCAGDATCGNWSVATAR